jgi:hypothetical protein
MHLVIGVLVYALVIVMLVAGADQAGTLGQSPFITAAIMNVLAGLMGYIASDATKELLP